MKQLNKIILIMLFLALPLLAQTTTDNIQVDIDPAGFQLHYESLVVDSAETIYSQTFRVSGDNVSYTDYPFHFGYDVAAADSIKLNIYWIVSFDNTNWVTADTLASVTSATAAKSTFDLNNVKAPFNKIKIVNAAGASDNTLNLGIYHPIGN